MSMRFRRRPIQPPFLSAIQAHQPAIGHEITLICLYLNNLLRERFIIYAAPRSWIQLKVPASIAEQEWGESLVAALTDVLIRAHDDNPQEYRSQPNHHYLPVNCHDHLLSCRLADAEVQTRGRLQIAENVTSRNTRA